MERSDSPATLRSAFFLLVLPTLPRQGGNRGLPSSCVCLSPCVPRPPTPAGAQHPVHLDAFLLASPCLTGSPPASFMVTRLDIFGRGASHPTACMVPCVCLRHVVRLSAFLHNANTWYGWLTNPCPARTFTPQEAPNFAWRTRPQCRESDGSSAEKPLRPTLSLHRTPFRRRRATSCVGQ